MTAILGWNSGLSGVLAASVVGAVLNNLDPCVSKADIYFAPGYQIEDLEPKHAML